MTKTYKAETHISLTIYLGEKPKHISFDALTLKGSIFITSDQELQEAIENHRGFGTLFVLEESMEEPEKIAEPEEIQKKTEKITVSSLEDAADYLIEHFDISRTKLKSAKSITAAAYECGVEFEGI